MVAHLDLDSFFVAVERSRRPELIGRPVVIGGRPGSRGMVAAASREARRSGIRVGMPLAQAAIRCPDGVFLDGAFDAYFAASLLVDELLRREIPRHRMAVDRRSLRRSSAARAAARGSRDRRTDSGAACRTLGFDVSVGLARSKLVARIASRLGRPRGVVHVLDGYEARFLSPLKIEMLPGIDPALAGRLRAAGIRRLGQIARLSESQLSLLAGRAGATLARHAAGIDASRIRRTAMPPARIEEHQLRGAERRRCADPRGAARGGRAARPRTALARRLRAHAHAAPALSRRPRSTRARCR